MLTKVISLTRAHFAKRRRMHRKQLVSAKLFAFPPRGIYNGTPGCLGNSLALLPLADSPMTLANVVSHLGDGFPELKQIFHSGHEPHNEGDGLSRQGQPMIPVTVELSMRTISPMGRLVTPVAFKKQFATLLKAARISAGFLSQDEAAKALGIERERYKKWESGRTPVPALFIPVVCEVFDKDANYFFRTEAKAARKTA